MCHSAWRVPGPGDEFDVDALHAEFLQRGAIILHLPTNQPWGKREMAIATPDGHRMMIGQTI
jgi:uncharacterized glyoxalase superfamily protein PhnB